MKLCERLSQMRKAHSVTLYEMEQDSVSDLALEEGALGVLQV